MYHLDVNISFCLVFCFCILICIFVRHLSFWLKCCQGIALCGLIKSLHCCSSNSSSRFFPTLRIVSTLQILTFPVTVSTQPTLSQPILTHPKSTWSSDFEPIQIHLIQSNPIWNRLNPSRSIWANLKLYQINPAEPICPIVIHSAVTCQPNWEGQKIGEIRAKFSNGGFQVRKIPTFPRFLKECPSVALYFWCLVFLHSSVTAGLPFIETQQARLSR